MKTGKNNSVASVVLNSQSASFRAKNPHLFTTAAAHNAPQVGHHSFTPSSSTPAPVAQGKRLRQDTKPLMNKLEASFHSYLLAATSNNPTLRPQARRYKLGNGIWYKPDFTAVVGGVEHAWEVKGPHSFRGGFENLKVAAGLWPEVVWTLVWREQGQWRQQRVLA